VAVGTSTGQVLVCCDAGLLHSLDIHQPGASGSSALQEQRPAACPAGHGKAAGKQGSTPGGKLQEQRRNGVQAVVQRGRGFLVAGSWADVSMFEPAATSTRSK